MSSNEETPDTQPSTSMETNSTDISNVTEVNASSSSGALEAVSGGIEASSSSQAVSDNKTSVSDEYIRLRVITSEMTNEVHFRVKSTTTLGRLKRSYCSKLGFQVDELRFVFDGHRITDDDTPKSLGMINEDVIEIYQERTGGM